MLKEFRRAIPPWHLFLAGLLYGFTKGIELFIRFGYRIDPNELPMTDKHGVSHPTQFCVFTFGVLGLIAIVYGISRAFRFHPANVHWMTEKGPREFATFLRTTPWTPSKRLPWGSPTLGWVDAIVIGGILFLAMFEVPEPWTVLQGLSLIVSLFVAGYALVPACYAQTLRGHALSLAALFLMPLYMIAVVTPTLGVALSAMILLLSHLSSREALIAFPLVDEPISPRPKLGWPFDHLSPHEKSKWLKHSTSWKVVAWSGWATLLLMAAVELHGGWSVPRLDTVTFILLAGGAAAFLRLLTYVGGVIVYFRTRIITRRVIVPEIDSLFAPSLVVAVITSAAAGLVLWGMPAPLVLPLFLTSVVAAALLIGPSPHQWRLTCQGNLHATSIRSSGAKLKKQPTPGLRS